MARVNYGVNLNKPPNKIFAVHLSKEFFNSVTQKV